ERVHNLTAKLDNGMKQLGYNQVNKHYFDTLTIDTGSKEKLNELKKKFESSEINLRYFDDKYIGISIDETTADKDIDEVLKIFGTGKSVSASLNGAGLPEHLKRKSNYLLNPVFNTHH